jgi:hypothetical protein
MTRLEVILETVNELLEGSKRKWSKEKRMKHAAGRYQAAIDHTDRLYKLLDVFTMKQQDDMGARGHPANKKRHDARRKLAIMQKLISPYNRYRPELPVPVGYGEHTPRGEEAREDEFRAMVRYKYPNKKI